MGELHIALKTSDINTKICERKRIMCITYNKFCCCCCNVVTCSKVFAIIGLIGGILNVIFGFLSLAGTAAIFDQLLYTIPYADGILLVSIVISVVWMIPDACLLYGISKKKPGFMMVWLVVKMILLVLWTILSVLIIIVLSLGDELIIGSGHQNRIQAHSNHYCDNIRKKYINNDNCDYFFMVIYIIILAVLNALGYYLWDIVKSAYKQIKEENENVQAAGNYMMNTYEKSPPAQYNHRV